MNLALGAMGEGFEEHPQPGYHGHGNEALSHYKDQSVSLETSIAPPRLRFASCWSQCWTGSDRSFSLGFCFWFGFVCLVWVEFFGFIGIISFRVQRW